MAQPKYLAAGSTLLGAGAVWLSSRLAWMQVYATDDKAGDQQVALLGALWSNELTALAILLAAGSVAVVALKRFGRSVVGVVLALASAYVSWVPLQLFFSDPDAQRAFQLLSSKNSTSHQDQGALLNTWAQISNIEVHTLPLVLALIACALGFFGGIVSLLQRLEKKKVYSAYTTKSHRQAQLETMEDDPDSGRALWDALDADIDPTEDRRG